MSKQQKRIAKAFAKGRQSIRTKALCPYAREIYQKAWCRGAMINWKAS